MDSNYIEQRLDSISQELSSIRNKLEKAIKERDTLILVSNNEAARHLGCTPGTISRMIREGRLKRETIGDSTGIRYSSIVKCKPQ